jgi:hypothetical protein
MLQHGFTLNAAVQAYQWQLMRDHEKDDWLSLRLCFYISLSSNSVSLISLPFLWLDFKEDSNELKPQGGLIYWDINDH